MDDRPDWAWDRGRYDEVGRRLVELAALLVAAIEDRSGSLEDRGVVDLACGTGNVALAAARRGADVTGVDLGAGLLEIAGRRTAAQGVEATWLLADASATGLATAAFDVVVSSVGLIFVPERTKAIAEVARLLRPGGWFAYSAWVKDSDTPFFTPFERFLPADDDGGPQSWQWAESDVIGPELAADFDDIEIQSREYVWSFASVEEALQLVEASPMHVAGVEGVAEEDRPALRGAFAEAFEALKTPDGSIAYASPYVIVTARKRD